MKAGVSSLSSHRQIFSGGFPGVFMLTGYLLTSQAALLPISIPQGRHPQGSRVVTALAAPDAPRSPSIMWYFLPLVRRWVICAIRGRFPTREYLHSYCSFTAPRQEQRKKRKKKAKTGKREALGIKLSCTNLCACKRVAVTCRRASAVILLTADRVLNCYSHRAETCDPSLRPVWLNNVHIDGFFFFFFHHFSKKQVKPRCGCLFAKCIFLFLFCFLPVNLISFLWGGREQIRHLQSGQRYRQAVCVAAECRRSRPCHAQNGCRHKELFKPLSCYWAVPDRSLRRRSMVCYYGKWS